MLQGPLGNAWYKLAGDAPPIVHQLRTTCADRWVRFHSLPESKRYAESEVEYAELLMRHNTIIASFASPVDRSYLMTANYFDSHLPQPRSPELEQLDPDAIPWRSVPIEEDCYLHIFCSEVIWRSGCLDAMLRLVADDQLREVAIITADGAWAYHPYDGGGDLICPDTATRDSWAMKYHHWLSQHPGGL